MMKSLTKASVRVIMSLMVLISGAIILTALSGAEEHVEAEEIGVVTKISDESTYLREESAVEGVLEDLDSSESSQWVDLSTLERSVKDLRRENVVIVNQQRLILSKLRGLEVACDDVK